MSTCTHVYVHTVILLDPDFHAAYDQIFVQEYPLVYQDLSSLLTLLG